MIQSSNSFNLKNLTEDFQDMKEILPDAVNDFLVSLPKILSEMQIAIQTLSSKELHTTAHSLKSLVGIFHADLARKLVLEIQKLNNNSISENNVKIELIFIRLSTELSKLSIDLYTEFLAKNLPTDR